MLLWRRGALGNLYTPEYRVLWVVYLLALQSWYVSWYVVCMIRTLVLGIDIGMEFDTISINKNYWYELVQA